MLSAAWNPLGPDLKQSGPPAIFCFPAYFSKAPDRGLQVLQWRAESEVTLATRTSLAAFPVLLKAKAVRFGVP